MQITRVLKTVIVGLLLVSSGAMALRNNNLCEQSNTRSLCAGNWGLPRVEMPQIIDRVRDEYLASKDPKTIQEKRIAAHQLTPIQREISRPIVYSMMQSNQLGKFDPCDRSILVANNGTHHNIIDGHHTAVACRLLGGSQLATVIWDWANRVFEEVRRFPGVFRINLNDQQV